MSRLASRATLLLAILLLNACSEMPFAASSSPVRSGPATGHLSLVGVAPLVVEEGLAFGPRRPMPSLLASDLNLARVEARAVGNEVGMEMLCAAHGGHPDIVLMTRSPSLSEIRRCERAGIVVSADLLALNEGEWRGHGAFRQVWIAFVPAEIAQNPPARRAMMALRYRLGPLIEGSEYAEVFVPRRG